MRRALAESAWAASNAKNTYYSAIYKRIAMRRSAKRAIVATDHSILVAIWHMLKGRYPYHELEANYFTQLQPGMQKRYYLK
ncbi:MAG: hypothetical protein HS115_12725 [Spirochaetales bacterium]|nr:hypothetical protein [Spirochaetales bacterium]